MLVEFLPLLRGWRDFSIDIDKPVTIAPGNKYVLAESIHPGWLLSLQVSITGSPDAEFIIERYDMKEGLKRATIKPSSLLTLGLDLPNSSGLYLSEWDETRQFCCIAFTPSRPLPFWAEERRPIRIVLKAPKDTAIVLNGYTQVAFEIVDRKEFVESLREILAPEIKAEIKAELEKLGFDRLDRFRWRW